MSSPASFLLLAAAALAPASMAFAPLPARQPLSATRAYSSAAIPLHAMSPDLDDATLFEDDDEMIPVAEAFVHSKYKQIAKSHGHKEADSNDVKEILRSILPPVTNEELDGEVSKTLKLLLSHEGNTADSIKEDDFVSSIVKNTYWEQAGDLVVKELMYFDSLHAYYSTGSALLNDNDYDTLHENLTWEGSSVATMSASEAKFVTAVAGARRGEPLMDDDEYATLKKELKLAKSWVVDRRADALEKLGVDTFMGYLHRAL
mmetsp:Transcript_5861/g.13368  ORF Transcript_5861/g.13368 Transcript_5861/m.13368 type:complete len:260 (-) Transcript_5861:216-995(-)|eukprot:CAMPEP_0172307592 /NCGR_PEP_ID=MMETSP1058-20130122/8413_1 /TAXON_ID=83371 /ORGANISM="Detonula confervacea, Strain CCMP 353" /LENGTH=259 /DNA_ID=CAMNT_0013019799 /DNA_START=47 /DNA_END=826 /DNA_ORIENTATION=+